MFQQTSTIRCLLISLKFLASQNLGFRGAFLAVRRAVVEPLGLFCSKNGWCNQSGWWLQSL
jgi:hypothetical protein